MAAIIFVVGTNSSAHSEPHRVHIVFLNPGKSDPNDPTGGFWHSVTSFMEAAAEDLNIELETIYSERNHVLMKEQAKSVIARQNPPDYLIVVNEKLAADDIIRNANLERIKTFLLLNRFYGRQSEIMGQPREKFRFWIGSLVPDNHWAGYQLTRKIITSALRNSKDQNGQIVALAGDFITPASVERNRGMKAALKEFPNVKLKQSIVCNWRKDKARQSIFGLLRRYPKTTAVWTANDPMALGAIEGALDAGRRPGKDIFIGGINWDSPALDMIRKGKLTVSMGGHFMTGGWALVLIHDYSHGIDFSEGGNAQLEKRIFGLLDENNIEPYYEKFGGRDWRAIDFRKFSKVYNHSLKDYDFSVEALLRQ